MNECSVHILIFACKNYKWTTLKTLFSKMFNVLMYNIIIILAADQWKLFFAFVADNWKLFCCVPMDI